MFFSLFFCFIFSTHVITTEFSADYIGDVDNFHISYSLRSDNVEAELQRLLKETPDRVVSMKTADQEEYKCVLPVIERMTHQQQLLDYKGPNPAELVKPLIDEKTISMFGGNGYWFYDFAHGRYILQYHDNRETKERMEYSLGNYRADQSEEDAKKFDEMKPPKTKIRDVDYPYYPVHYRHGTPCDLTGKPRETTVMYVCHESARHMIYSITEVSTCNYELIVLTNLLCTHPAFQAPTTPEHEIYCYASPNAPHAKPAKFRNLEEQVFVEKFNQYSIDKDSSAAPSKSVIFDKLVAPESVARKLKEKVPMEPEKSNFVQDTPNRKDNSKLAQKIRTEKDFDFEAWEKQQEEEFENEKLKRIIMLYLRAEDESESLYEVIKDFETDLTEEERSIGVDFFAMKSCFVGGQGQLKYEFCYKKKITQYYLEHGKRTRETVLGVWDVDEHNKWFKANRKNAVVSKREALMQISNYYGNGDYCEETGEKRSVEARLKCRIPELGGSLDLVLLYLEEPSPCRYILYLESYLMCEALQNLNPQGLVVASNTMPPEDQYLEELDEIYAKRMKKLEERRANEATEKRGRGNTEKDT